MLFTPPAIVPQHSIRGVAPGMTRSAVNARLGMPGLMRHGSDDFGPWTSYTWRGLKVTFRGGLATQLETSSPRDRTATGVGIGSTKAQVQAGVAGVVCEPGHCHVGLYRAGRIVTDFFVRRGRVWRVLLGRVLD